MFLSSDYGLEIETKEIELEGIHPQHIVDVVKRRDMQSIPSEHIQLVRKVFHRRRNTSLGPSRE